MEDKIARLESKIDTMHDCLDGMRDEQTALGHKMGNYFLGVQPETHVRHHNALFDSNEISGDKRRAWYEGIGALVSMVVATTLINIAAVGYLTTNLGKQLSQQQTEQHK